MVKYENLWSKVKVEALDDLYKSLPGSGSLGLKRHIASTVKGCSIDLRSPFYKNKTRKEIISLVNEKVGSAHVPELDDQDDSEKLKVGTISIVKPASDRIEGLLAYWDQSFNPDRSAFWKAVWAVSDLIEPHSIKAISMEESFRIVLSRTQSLGFPWLGRDKKRLAWYRDDWLRLKDPKDAWPCMWYVRCQPMGSDVESKNRDVWGYWHGETCGGQMFVHPVVNRLRSLPKGFSAWLGFEAVDVAITRLLSNYPLLTKNSMDFSGYDKTISGELLDAAKNILMLWCEQSISSTIDLVVEIEKTVPIVTPYGILSGRRGGMPSGSVATNLIDSIINLIAGYYVAYRCSATLLDYEVMGDDSVFVWDRNISRDVIAEIVSELGLTSNPEKQLLSVDSVHYLQRLHLAKYKLGGLNVGVRSIYRAISGITGLERIKEGNNYLFSARLLSQLQQCSSHPCFIPFVRFWYDGDTVLKSGVDPVMVIKKAGGYSKVREAVGSLSFSYNAVDPEGVNGWAVTNVIRSFRS